MVRDRSSEFRRKVASNEVNLEVLENGSVSDGTTDSFFNDVFEVRKLMEDLSNNIQSLNGKQSDVLAKPTVDDAQKVELDNYIGAIKQQIQNLKPRLISMKTSLEQDEKHLNASWNSADMRIRKHQMESLMKKLSDLIEQFTAAQTDYRQRVARRIKRQLELAGERASDAEIESMLDSKSTQIFYRGMSSAAAQSAIADASSRHAEILRLEQSVSELNEMYNDIAFLVHSQGESVSRIDENVENAFAHVEEGAQSARQAVRYKKSALHKKIYCYILVVVVVLVIIAVIIILAVTLSK
ncbi:unnamed protein product [Enterobius vermicularis]|uniref:t-SNARE coiled-coil homology domain-containing protein n=1 Tax=Enterobius vermicularis TaxID=51028 RepID=A0A0N4VBY5_ENTVE|nr:unnamed protein product [Enterobius vermicularis]